MSISYSRRKSRIRCREKVLLTNQLILLKRQLASGSDSVKAEILDLETALSSLFTLELGGLKIRSRVRWLEEGETPSRIFLNMGNQRRERSYVSSILNSDDVEVSSLEELLTVHEQFYTLLYSEEPIDSEVQNFLFSQVTSRLSQPESDSCEGPLSLEELTEALRISNKNKTPGPDELTTEFYGSFWDFLGPLLVDFFNECFANGELCQSMKASLTRLVFKRDDRRCLKNWARRPISLLNSDYKIGSKAFSLRLSKVLGSIINTDQTCSVLHRSIFSNLTLLRDILHFIDWSGETGILISLDQEKAFDRVDRNFLMNLLNLFGFGPSFRNWIFTLYNDAYMQIIVNDFLTSPVKLSRGVRQGDALSPMLYVLCVEIFACTIRDSSQIVGFLLHGAAGAQFKVSQYADDTTVFVKDESSLVYLFKAISLYEKGSRARLNISKTKAMWLGNWKDRCDKPLGLNWVDKMKVLEIVFGNVNVERDNWEPRLSKVDKMLSLWRSRSLSLVGKVLILNTLAFSKLFYLSRILEPPKWVYGRIKSLIWPFLWGSRMETVARRSIICSLEDGGLYSLYFFHRV